MTRDEDRNQESETLLQLPAQPEHTSSRRSFLGKSLALGAGVAGAGMLPGAVPALARESANAITSGDVAVLRFLAAIELIETDLWQQYNELGGVVDREVPGGKVIDAYVAALSVLDGDMAQYIHDNTEDEISHAAFLNAYLESRSAEPVNLDRFRTLPSSKATGAQQIGRLTNLMQLTVDTSWWIRYRSRTQNPDLGATFPQAVPDLARGQFPAIPRNDADLDGSTPTTPSAHLQAIANTAAFHFGFIEQGGSSLYPTLAQEVTNPEVLRILLSIGPVETAHFQTWQDKAGNGVAQPVAPLTDPTNGLVFPDLNASGSEDTQTNLIMPEPTVFLSNRLPKVSVIRPTLVGGSGGAMATVAAFAHNGLFIGQPRAFVQLLLDMAAQADGARNGPQRK